MSHAGFGNVHGDIVNLATSGGAAPAFPPVEDDLRLPAQPKDVSDLRKGDVVAFDEAHLPGHEAFPCVKLKQLGAAVAKVRHLSHSSTRTPSTRRNSNPHAIDATQLPRRSSNET